MKSNIACALKATALSAVAFAAFTPEIMAMPASPRPVYMRQPDGSYREVLLHGDERSHAITTPDGATLLRPDAHNYLREAGEFDAPAFCRSMTSSSMASPRLQSTNTFPAHGKQRALAILVEYPETDQHPQGRRFSSDDPRSLFDNLLNAPDYSTDGATGSVRQYFLDSSCGVFDISFDVFGPITLKEDLSYYVKLTNGENLDAWRMVVEACEAIDDVVDFHDYDRDGDGLIDNVYIFYAGPGGATGGDPTDCIWQHAADVETITGNRYLFDGLRLNHYACSNEYRDVRTPSGEMVRQTEGIGTVCHEFSHVLGLPDLYDVTGSGHTTPGIWSVMDQGCHINESRTPCQYSVLDRMMLGWLEPEDIGTEPWTLSLRDISTNQAYRIATGDPDEYFLLENRQRTGWDAYLPGHGMIVWHINYLQSFWDRNQVNTSRSLSQAVIIPADGYNGPASYAGDPFPGTSRISSLTDDGYPNMLTVLGNRSNAPLSGITEVGGIVSFDICRAVTKLDKVTGLSVSDVTPTGFTASWDALPMSPGYIFNLSTRDAGEQWMPVDIYSDLNVVGNTLDITGLSPASDYRFTVRGVAGAVVGEDSDPYTLTTPGMSFRYTAPTATGATGVTDRAFTAHWLPLDEASDYALSVWTLERGYDRIAAVDFTGGIEALPSGWVTTCISTMSMKGYFGSASPALSMGADYARLQSPLLPADICGLEFWYRERTPSGKSALLISALADGEWREIHRLELKATSSDHGEQFVLDRDLIPAGTRAVRIVYRRADKGNLAIDDVKIWYTGVEQATPVKGWEERQLLSADTEATVDGLAPSTEYHFSVKGIHPDGTLSSASQPLAVTTSVAGSITLPSANAPLSVSVSPDGHVTVTGCDNFDIYDIHGRRMGHQLPSRGIYLVRVNNNTVKLHY